MNLDTARTQARLNRGDTFTPFGTVTNRDLGAEWMDQQVAQHRERFNNGDAAGEAWAQNGFDEAAVRRALAASNPNADRWETHVKLSPEQQRLYEQGVQLDQGGNQLALDMLPRARETLMAPMARDDADARDRATAGIMSRLEPQFARDREALEGRLLAQGFQPGTEAYRRAADELNRTVTDARMQALTLGSQESRNAAAFSNAQRAQQINELGMLFGLGPGMQMPQGAQMAPVGLQSPDLMGAVYSNYNAQMQNHQANNANWFGLLGSALGAGGFALGNAWRLSRNPYQKAGLNGY